MSLRHVLLLLVTTFLLGCQGFYGSDRRTVGEVLDDSYITTALNAKLLKDDQLSVTAIDVDSKQGIVLLFGNVETAEQEARALQLAREIKGVRSVESRLVIIPKQVR